MTTRMLSAFRMVESRCAITILVLPFMIVSSASWIAFSEMESNAEVASSRIRMRGSCAVLLIL